MGHRNLLTAAIFAALLPHSIAHGQLKGAQAVLSEIESSRKQPAKSDERSDRLRKEIAEFGRSFRGMSPERAADGWLALCRNWTMTPAEEPSRANFPSLLEGPALADLLAVLPGPETWPRITTRLDKEYGPSATAIPRSAALAVLGRSLANDDAGQWHLLDRLLKAAKAGGAQTSSNLYPLGRLFVAAAVSSGDPAKVIRAIEVQTNMPGYGGSVELPDLISLIGTQKAEAVLRKALVSSYVPIGMPAGEATKRLAINVALDTVKRHKVPHWQLTYSPDATLLYEAMLRRFKSKTPQDESQWERRQAVEYYVSGLVAQGRVAEAVKAAAESKDVYWTSTFSAASPLPKHATEFVSAMREHLEKNPEARLWDLFIPLAAKVGRAQDVPALVRAGLAMPKLSAKTRFELQRHLVSALLAADKVDEAVELTHRMIASAPKDERGSAHDLASSIVRVGYLLKRSDWIGEGLASYRKAIGTAERGYGFDEGWTGLSVLEILLRLNRPADAEQLLLLRLKRSTSESEYSMPGVEKDTFLALARLYHRVGRSDDVLHLLTNAKGWGVRDIVELDATRYGSTEGPTAVFLAASSLVEVGKVQAAEPLLTAAVLLARGYDPAYEILVKAKGENALTILDQLYQQDKFEERPLIWKAKVLLDLKRLDAAEEAIRAAIAIDPSDGEQPRGRRMFAYAVLGDILDAQGKKEESDLMRSAVRAIRMAEDADELFNAGLLTRSIAHYKLSLKVFEDAYCIQSRLAVQLASAGRWKEAEVHYRKAYELMPDSFGRMESHCFGCEGVFEGVEAQQVAEAVFLKLAEKTPRKPQVHYLLGVLRESQGRLAQAFAHYKTAADLDPDYINAWKQMKAISDKVTVAGVDRQRIVLALLRLDPFATKAEGEIALHDLKTVYLAANAAAEGVPVLEVPERLFQLKASEKELDEMTTGNIGRVQGYFVSSGSMKRTLTARPSSGGQAISRVPVIRAALEMAGESSATAYFRG